MPTDLRLPTNAIVQPDKDRFLNEDNPFEAVQTNVIGAKNVVNASIRAGVKRVVAISTDKAVKPVNAMGMSKALQEKVMLDANTIGKTTFNVVRYGNVVGSRGSVVPLFKDSITAGQPLPVTQADMTRFWLSLQDAIDLVMFAAEYAHGGRILVKKAPACSIGQLARIVAKSMGKEDYPIKHVGLRKGEKVHEVLVAENEMVVAKDEGDYYVVDPNEKMPVGHQGKEYTSENTHQLTDSELEKVLAKALEMTNEAYYYNL
ncbi:polysaccharide biosynthesis protein [Candidatus Micrarchaeota archaeon]|nr:polysaccharide biosynthesis protein [Candidatus Micrarchaeota archaeon]